MEILLGLLYFVIGVVLSSLLVRFEEVDTDNPFAPELLFVTSVLWPLFILALALFTFCSCLFKVIKYIGGKK